MKTVILAGGLGTRITSVSEDLPKCLIEIGGIPIVQHIMYTYSFHGHNDFILCGGHKIKEVKKYFLDYHIMQNDVRYDLSNGQYEILNKNNSKQIVSVINTGLRNNTGSRLKQIRKFIDDKFFLTYCDALCDIDINKLLDYHNNSQKICTMSCVRIQNKFGVLTFDENNNLKSFTEKPIENNSWINAGYFVCEKEIFDYIPEGDDIQFEKEPIQNLIKNDQLNIFKHEDFWKCMDTKKDYLELQEMWENNPVWIKNEK